MRKEINKINTIYLNKNTHILFLITYIHFYFHIPEGNGSMVMAKKIVFEIIADSDCTTLRNMQKVIFRKVSVCLCVCRFFSMANEKSHKFKQNQILFHFYVVFILSIRPVSYTHLDVYKRQKLPLSLNRSSPKTIGREYSTNQGCMQKIIWFCLNIDIYYLHYFHPINFPKDMVNKIEFSLHIKLMEILICFILMFNINNDRKSSVPQSKYPLGKFSSIGVGTHI